MAAKEQATYCNPFWTENFPDPFVLKVCGRYYAYATDRETYPPTGSWVFPILTSSDLVQWREIGKAMPALGQPYGRYWAPEVTVHNGQFLLYYAVHTTEFTGSIRVAVADRPEGPFTDSGHDLTSSLFPWAIDPHVFRDLDGQWYLYMTVEYWDDPGGFIGSGNIVDRLIDPFTLQGHPARVTPPQHQWQLFEAQREDRGGVDWYTVEGPAVIRHRGRYYEMFSGGCYYRDNYAVSYATSDTPMGPGGTHDSSWHDWEGTERHPFLIHGDGKSMISPGHNSLVFGPNNAELYTAYHAWQQDRVARRPCLDRLFWHGDQLWTAAPTHTPQPAPALPRLRELFEEPALQSFWHQRDGRWKVSNGEVVQEDDTAVRATLQHQDSLSAAWLLEVNLRHIAGTGSYGVLLQSEAGTTVSVTITPGSRLAVWSGTSPAEPIQTMSLPAAIDATAWQQLIISLSGSVLSVQLDYLRPLEALVEHPARTFSLFTQHCSAAFSGISLTDHFRDEFLNNQQTPALLGWSVEAGTESELRDTSLAHWRVHDGALEQTSTAPGEHIVLKGPILEQYECGVTMMLHCANEQGQPALGLVVWHSAREKLLVWLLSSQAHWALAVESSGSTPGADSSFDLPESFDPFKWHTLRLRRRGDQLTVYLDGPEVLTMTIPPRLERSGLATRGAAAAFTGVWQTGLPAAY
jgi:GH43 family beta-xylosidase